MCEALRELFKDELEDAERRGEKRGKKYGVDQIRLLYSKLKKDGREEEIFQALSDSERMEELYKEYGIE